MQRKEMMQPLYNITPNRVCLSQANGRGSCQISLWAPASASWQLDSAFASFFVEVGNSVYIHLDPTPDNPSPPRKVPPCKTWPSGIVLPSTSAPSTLHQRKPSSSITSHPCQYRNSIALRLSLSVQCLQRPPRRLASTEVGIWRHASRRLVFCHNFLPILLRRDQHNHVSPGVFWHNCLPRRLLRRLGRELLLLLLSAAVEYL